MNVNKTTFLGLAAVLAALAWTDARAQDAPYECDDRYQDCGAPQQTGGGGGGGGSVLINNTDLGDSYQYADDYDDDGIEDPYDNCPFAGNADQADDDGDGVGSSCDNCPADFNQLQEDLDGDLIGDDCDADDDGDGVEDGVDLCERSPDPAQKDTDGDGLGDACDPDMDDDGIPNLEDNCPLVANPEQANDDPDAWGDACDDDDDADGIRNTWDNCTQVANLDQDDLDADGLGDACDADLDDDGWVNLDDNCARTANEDQEDLDRDRLGDVCDDRFCFVVEEDLDNCLDPSLPLQVYSPMAEVKTGQEHRLRLFANRVNQPMRYTWEVVEAPVGSTATVDAPLGAVSISTPFEYHYLLDNVASFTPDQPGTYTLRLQAEGVWPDPVTGELGARAEVLTVVEATGEPMGCSSAAGSRGVGLALLGLVGLVGLSRRRAR